MITARARFFRCVRTSFTRVSALCMLFFVLAVSASVASASVIHVKIDATGKNDGSSWANAFPDLAAAIFFAQPGDEIWVAAATYRPEDASQSFVLKSAVAVYGGFNGTESLRSQRNVAANPTILSGDILNDDVLDPSPFAPPWPGNYHINTANSAHVVIAENLGSSSVLDGFRIEKGAYGPTGSAVGGGIFVVNSSLTVANCTIAGNFAAFGPGGGIYLLDSSPIFSHCTFDHNFVHLGSGGGIYIGGSSQPVISDCTFTTNLVTSYSGQEGQGGAIQDASSLPVTISRCIFNANEARPFSAGVFEIPRGGAISSFALNTTTTVRDCVFRNNRAPYGAGIFSWNSTTVINCTFDHNIATTYTASGNITQGGSGAGLNCQWSTATIINSTFAHNTGMEGVSINVFSYPGLGGLAIVRNCIIWGNVANGEGVSLRDAALKGDASVNYSCVQDLLTPEPGEDPPDPANYPGCLVIDPLLVDGPAGNLHLAMSSPCIDAGRNSFVPAGVLTDLDLLPRLVEIPSAPNTGNGAAPLVDMGAFEFQLPSACPADIAPTPAGDDLVNIDDLTAIILAWGSSDPAADIDNDSLVEIDDLTAVILAWGVCP